MNANHNNTMHRNNENDENVSMGSLNKLQNHNLVINADKAKIMRCASAPSGSEKVSKLIAEKKVDVRNDTSDTRTAQELDPYPQQWGECPW
jgi:hypothetical protein